VASERKTCKSSTCHTKFSRPLGSRREYCETCRPPRKPSLADRAPSSPPPVDPGVGPIEARTLSDLQAVERHDTVPGLLVLALARDIDRGVVKPEQKGVAGQRLLQLLTTALAGTQAPAPADRLDEVAARRIQKAAAAS
jgi:hypothetical protein